MLLPLGRPRRETHYRPFTLRTITWWARRVPPAATTPLPTLHFRPTAQLSPPSQLMVNSRGTS
ncbi:MAG TPA: hypothetical protein VIY07_01825, partial [Pseudolabrys sp.]